MQIVYDVFTLCFRLETNSRLYSVKEDGFLTVVYELETKGATGACHFVVEDIDYLVISNSMDNNQVSAIIIFVIFDFCVILSPLYISYGLVVIDKTLYSIGQFSY